MPLIERSTDSIFGVLSQGPLQSFVAPTVFLEGCDLGDENRIAPIEVPPHIAELRRRGSERNLARVPSNTTSQTPLSYSLPPTANSSKPPSRYGSTLQAIGTTSTSMCTADSSRQGSIATPRSSRHSPQIVESDGGDSEGGRLGASDVSPSPNRSSARELRPGSGHKGSLGNGPSVSPIRKPLPRRVSNRRVTGAHPSTTLAINLPPEASAVVREKAKRFRQHLDARTSQIEHLNEVIVRHRINQLSVEDTHDDDHGAMSSSRNNTSNRSAIAVDLSASSLTGQRYPYSMYNAAEIAPTPWFNFSAAGGFRAEAKPIRDTSFPMVRRSSATQQSASDDSRASLRFTTPREEHYDNEIRMFYEALLEVELDDTSLPSGAAKPPKSHLEPLVYQSNRRTLLEKVAQIPMLLSKFHGFEEDLFRLLKAKYNTPAYRFTHFDSQ